MFITRLYRHNKIAAISFSLFILAFIFLNYKWGVVASPIYQLGMYSGVAHKTDTQRIYSLYVDNKPLILGDLPIAHADMIRVSLSRYEDHIVHNLAVMEVFNKYSIKVSNRSLPLKSFTNSINEEQAGLWFLRLLRSYDIPATKFSVYSNKYIWRQNKLRPVAQEELKYIFAADL